MYFQELNNNDDDKNEGKEKGKGKEKVRTDSTAVVAENGEEEEVEAEAENDVFAPFEEDSQASVKQRSGDLHRHRPSFLNHTSVQRAVRNHNTAVEVQAVQENASAHILKKRQSIDQANKEARRRLQARLQAQSISAGKKKKGVVAKKGAKGADKAGKKDNQPVTAESLDTDMQAYFDTRSSNHSERCTMGLEGDQAQ